MHIPSTACTAHLELDAFGYARKRNVKQMVFVQHTLRDLVNVRERVPTIRVQDAHFAEVAVERLYVLVHLQAAAYVVVEWHIPIDDRW